MIIIREKPLFPIGIILGAILTTLLLVIILLSNSGFFSKNHTYKKER